MEKTQDTAPVPRESLVSSLTRLQKLALLIGVIGKDVAASVLKNFDKEEVDRIAQAIIELEDEKLANEATVKRVVEEFHGVLEGEGAFLTNLGRALDECLEALYGRDVGGRMAEKVRETSRARFPFRVLRGLRSQDLASVLLEEHPQIRAIVIANLDADQAADVLMEFEEEVRPDIVQRIATMDEPLPHIVKQVADAIAERTRTLKRAEAKDPLQKDPRVIAAANILNASRGGAEKTILEKLRETAPELSERIKDSMFEFKDLVLLDKRTMQKLLASLDTKVLARALKAGPDAVREALLGSVSQRTRDMILEEKELIGAIPLAEVVDAQKEIVAAVRQLIESGEIQLSRAGGSVYVA